MNFVRRTLFGALITGLVVVGLMAQAGAHLMGFTTPAHGEARAMDERLTYAQPGPHSVGVRHLTPQQIPLVLTVWYPALDSFNDGPGLTYSYALNMLSSGNATALATFEGTAHLDVAPDLGHGPYPVVVLSSGFAISAESYAWLAEHLASYGMVVVAPDHHETLDPRNLWRSTLDRPKTVDLTRSYLEVASRRAGVLGRLVDTDSVGVVGHSYGGYTALASAGAEINATAFAKGCTSARADDPIQFLCDALLPRITVLAARNDRSRPPGEDLGPQAPVDAAVSLAGDAAMFGKPGLARVTAPLLVMGGTADRDSPFNWSSRLAYDGVSSHRKIQIGLEGAEHFVFAGQCGRVRRLLTVAPVGFCTDPAWDREQARYVTEHYVTAFLLSELLGVPAAEASLSPNHDHLDHVRYRAAGY